VNINLIEATDDTFHPEMLPLNVSFLNAWSMLVILDVHQSIIDLDPKEGVVPPWKYFLISDLNSSAVREGH
jgi:hypothetical protein